MVIRTLIRRCRKFMHEIVPARRTGKTCDFRQFWLRTPTNDSTSAMLLRRYRLSHFLFFVWFPNTLAADLLSNNTGFDPFALGFQDGLRVDATEEIQQESYRAGPPGLVTGP